MSSPDPERIPPRRQAIPKWVKVAGAGGGGGLSLFAGEMFRWYLKAQEVAAAAEVQAAEIAARAESLRIAAFAKAAQAGELKEALLNCQQLLGGQ